MTAIETNGPDRFNSNPGCSRHQAGVKTGIKDYCCCCDPCQYVRDPDDPGAMSRRLCCRCSPRFILAKYTPDNADSCCRQLATPMGAAVWKDNSDQDVVRYIGEIAGHTVLVYLSNERVDDGGYVESPYPVAGCRWTIRIDSLGVYEEIAIDHVEVTCLGVPAISIMGVTTLETCVGTISLANYETVKLPFQKRVFPDSYPDGYGMMLPFPEGYACDGCTEIPRFICVSNAQIYTARKRQLNADEKLQLREANFWKEFEWQVDFEPYVDHTTYETIIGVWRYHPEDPEAFVESLYLIQDTEGICWLQPDFVEPPTTDGEGEFYQRVQLTSCGCNMKILNVRPVDDLSDTPENRDGSGLDYRIGRCGCWTYVCGNRRCVNRYFCGFVYVGRVLYRKILFTWDGSVKAWVSSGGTDPDGNAMPHEITIHLGSDGAGGCQMQVMYSGYGDYDITPIAINDSDTVFSKTFSGVNAAKDDYFTLFITTSFDGECNDTVICTQATPCADRCGSHPDVLYANFRGWTEPYDIPPLMPPVTGECLNEVTLVYRQQIVSIVDGVISYICGYIGYSVVESAWINPETSISEVVEQLLVFEFTMAAVTITRRLLSDPTTILNTDVVSVHESCDPYYGYYSSFAQHGPLLQSCFFGDNRIFFYRYTIDITE